MGKGVVKLGEGNWAVKDGNLLAAKETNGRFKNAEFTVARGTDATYVGRDGLIKRTSSNIESEVFINPTFDATIPLGSNGSGWSDDGVGEVAFYNGGLKMTTDGSGAAKARARDASLSSGILETSRLYELTYEIKSISSKSNTLSLYVAGNTITITQKSVGTHTILIASGTNANKIFQLQWTQADSESIVLGNVSLKESLVANGTFDADLSSWSPGTGWSWDNGKASNNGSSGSNNLTQTSILDIGKTYKITITVSDWVSGNVEVSAGASPRGTMSANGTYTFYQTCTPNNNFYIIANAFNGSIDNVSVFEIDNGALPRIDFTENTDGHLLLEPESTNLVTYSEDFSNSFYQKIRSSITVNQIISPDGTQNADKFKEDSSNDTHLLWTQDITVNNGDNITWSVYAKKGERNWIYLRDTSAGNFTSWFDLENGVAGTKTGSLTANIQDAGNGWYRCSITYTSTSTTAKGRIYTAIADNTESYLGDGTSGIYIWGAQLEELPYPTSYIPTNGGTVTRDGEVVSRESIDEIDIPQEEGTIYLELEGYEKNTEIFNFDRSTSNSIHVGTDNNGALKVWGYYEPSGTGTSTSAMLNNNTRKVAIAFKNGSFIVYADGEEELNTSTFVWTPTDSIDRLYFNRGGYIASQGLSKVKALRIYKEAFNTTQLDELTSL